MGKEDIGAADGDMMKRSTESACSCMALPALTRHVSVSAAARTHHSRRPVMVQWTSGERRMAEE